SPHNTRAASSRQNLILTSHYDDLNSFPAEDSPTGRPDDDLILPEQHARYDYALRMFESEGEPPEAVGLLQTLPAPPPSHAAPDSSAAPVVAPIRAQPSRRRAMQITVVVAAAA